MREATLYTRRKRSLSGAKLKKAFHLRSSFHLIILLIIITSCKTPEYSWNKPILIPASFIDVLYDLGNTKEFDEISNVTADFETVNKYYLANPATVWVRLDTDQIIPYFDSYFLSLIGNAEEIDVFYYKTGQGWTRLRSGVNLPIDSRSIQLSHPVFSLEGIERGQPIFIRLFRPVVSLISLEHKATAATRDYNTTFYSSLLLGILLFIITINLYRGVSSKNWIFILYSFYVLTFFATILVFNSINMIHLVFDISPYTKHQLNNAFVLLMNLAGAWYGIVFLNLRQKGRVYYFILLSLIILFIIFYVIITINPTLGLIFANLGLAILTITLLAAGIDKWIQGEKYVSYYVVAYAIFAGISISYTWLRNTDPTYPYLDDVPMFFYGFVIEVLLINLSLNQKIDLERQQAIDSQAKYHTQLMELKSNQNSLLEEKVKERTKELERTLADLKNAQDHLVKSEKMAALGVLTAGIAHEINNPVNFVYAGANSLRDNLKEIREVLNAYDEVNAKNAKNKLSQIDDLKSKVDYEKLIEYVDRSTDNVLKGAERTSEIVKGLKSFSRADDGKLVTTDIHECLDNTLVLLLNQYKDRIQISRKYGKVRKIQGSPGKLSQVFVNVLGNAIQAIEGKGKINISTKTEKRGSKSYVRVSIKDTGKGIALNEQKRIFEPFYTTKEVGQGTGLGLSISHSIIEEHGGKIEVESEEGAGTEFRIFLPVN